MPKTAKGRKIHAAMVKQYGKKKGEAVFFASRNKGTITGVDRDRGRGGGSVPAKKASMKPTGKAKPRSSMPTRGRRAMPVKPTKKATKRSARKPRY